MSTTPLTPVGPSSGKKLLVSFLVVAQFFVIFTVVTSASSPNFPSPKPAQDMATLTRPYAQAFFMHNAYRFYAPEPGPTNLLWARFQYTDGTCRWKEMPRLQDYSSRIPYQRHIALLLMLGMAANQVVVTPDGKEGAEALTDPNAVIKSRYSPIGRICIQSFVRHLAQLPDYSKYYGNGADLVSVEMYHVLHYYLAPDHTKLGWRYEDPRLYAVTYVGTYDPQGKPYVPKSQDGSEPLLTDATGTPITANSPYLQGVSVSELFAIRIVETDLLPFLQREQVNTESEAALAAALERFGMPLPFCWPILKDRSLLQPQSRESRQKLFEQVLLNDETPHARERLLNPPRQYTAPQAPRTDQPSDPAHPGASNPKKPGGITRW
jgi:hypothetical protein